jgi:1-acyl-sn-glycerol-3-phosphate acyltransferase
MSAPSLIPGQYAPRFAKVFGWYTRRLFQKKFSAVRLAHGSRELLSSVAGTDAPLVIAMNHSSWWDPLIAVLLGRALCPRRWACAPIDAPMLAKFGMFKKLGLFGIDPDDPRGLPEMAEYVLTRFAQDRKPTLWITPQGRFSDVRDPVVIRPGVAAILARCVPPSAPPVVLSVAIEYAFWLEQKPEVFLRLVHVEPPDSPSTPHWHRALESTMQANAQALAKLVQARDTGAFELLLDGVGARTQPLMELWLRLQGKNSAIEDRTRGGRASMVAAPPPPPPHSSTPGSAHA